MSHSNVFVVYLLQVPTPINVFKIGFSQNFAQRLRGYPKGTIVVNVVNVVDCRTAERSLLAAFRHRFKQRSDIGREYFEGALEDVRILFDSVSATFGQSPPMSVNEHLHEASSCNRDHDDIDDLNSPNTWRKFVAESLEVTQESPEFDDWFRDTHSLLMNSDVPHASIGRCIEEANLQILAKINTFDIGRRRPVTSTCQSYKLVLMSWSYILCYDESCFIDFQALDSDVSCIYGRNGEGKSALLETICIALFGESIPSRHNKRYSSAIICNQKPYTSRAHTSIVVDIDGIRYRINRSFKSQEDSTKINACDTRVSIVGGEVVADGGCAVHAWIRDRLGNAKAFLTSAMITQSMDHDFFALDAPDQCLEIERVLDLRAPTSFMGLLRDVLDVQESVLRLAKYVQEELLSHCADFDVCAMDVCKAALASHVVKVDADNDVRMSLTIKAGIFEVNFAEHTKKTKMSAKLAGYISGLGKTCSLLRAVEKALGGFKEWVMRTKAIPLLVDNANAIIRDMRIDRPISIVANFPSYNNSTFAWLLEDGLNTPPIEKASSFQRLIVSLAMRIALNDLGGQPRSCQLFIDDGFSRCDKNNLASIPAFLGGLVGDTYDAVIVFSHLQGLQFSSSFHIQRIHDKGLSHISVGDQSNPLIPHKIRPGRKKMFPRFYLE